jgi:hypothetical protein
MIMPSGATPAPVPAGRRSKETRLAPALPASYALGGLGPDNDAVSVSAAQSKGVLMIDQRAAVVLVGQAPGVMYNR